MENIMKNKYILVSILRADPDSFFGGCDCANNGVTSDTKGKQYFVPVKNGNFTEESIKKYYGDLGIIFEVVKEKNVGGGINKSLVVKGEKRCAMMGGNFGYCSDSRFRKSVSKHPIPIHDRHEA
jgi:hypothetical protein